MFYLYIYYVCAFLWNAIDWIIKAISAIFYIVVKNYFCVPRWVGVVNNQKSREKEKKKTKNEGGLTWFLYSHGTKVACAFRMVQPAVLPSQSQDHHHHIHHHHQQLQFYGSAPRFYHVGANGRTAPRRFVFHFGLIYCAQATLALFSTPRHSTTPHPTNVPHKTWYQRSSNGDLQSLQALPVTINSLGRRRYISSCEYFCP